jgi:hypothetical protein
MPIVKRVRTSTYAVAVIYDPLPMTLPAKRFDDCTHEAVVAALEREYGNDLICVMTYDVRTIDVDGERFHSDPQNKRKWSKA